MKKAHPVAMLPTEKAESKLGLVKVGNSNLSICKWYKEFEAINKELRGEYNLGMKENHFQKDIISQHLYILSNDEIKEGELGLHNNGEISRAILLNAFLGRKFENGKIAWYERGNYPKSIIASTDKEITPNSWIPEKFVLAYIKAYNDGTPITEVSLEYEPNCQIVPGKPTICKCILNHYKGDDCIYEKPKTRSDGSVIIYQSKMYSRDEVICFLKEYRNSIMTVRDKEIEYLNNWVEENL